MNTSIAPRGPMIDCRLRVAARLVDEAEIRNALANLRSEPRYVDPFPGRSCAVGWRSV